MRLLIEYILCYASAFGLGFATAILMMGVYKWITNS
jgi:hypothetical protein